MIHLIIEEIIATNNSAALASEMQFMLKYNKWHRKNESQQRPVTRNLGLGVVQAYVTFDTEEEAVLYKLTNWDSLHGKSNIS